MSVSREALVSEAQALLLMLPAPRRGRLVLGAEDRRALNGAIRLLTIAATHGGRDHG